MDKGERPKSPRDTTPIVVNGNVINRLSIPPIELPPLPPPTPTPIGRGEPAVAPTPRLPLPPPIPRSLTDVITSPASPGIVYPASPSYNINPMISSPMLMPTPRLPPPLPSVKSPVESIVNISVKAEPPPPPEGRPLVTPSAPPEGRPLVTPSAPPEGRPLISSSAPPEGRPLVTPSAPPIPSSAPPIIPDSVRVVTTPLSEPKTIPDDPLPAPYQPQHEEKKGVMPSRDTYPAPAPFQPPATNPSSGLATGGADIPNYSAMTSQERAGILAEFRAKFNTLRRSFPQYQYPEVLDTSDLTEIHIQYERHIRQVHIEHNVSDYKIYLIIMFLGIEFFGIKVLGLRFWWIYVKSISNYE